MPLENKKRLTYNPYFIYPFLLWVVVGGVLISLYDKTTLFAFINGHYSPMMDTLMYYATGMGEAVVIITVLLGLMIIPKFRNWWYFALAAACNVVPMLLSQAMKSILDKPRPMHYFEHASWVHMLEPWERIFERSFPSGHSEGAFSFFCFLSLLLLSKHKAWGALFFVLALSVCYSRVYLTAHFFEDTYAGSIIGVTSCTAVFMLMHKYVKKYFSSTHKGV